MFLQEIQLINFKNYAEATLHFSHRATALVGLNGTGKTNLLDAIHYLSMLRSFVNHADTHHIRQGADFFFIRGRFLQDDKTHEVTCRFQLSEGKTVTEDGKKYTRLSDHIGKYPVVLIAPQDGVLISGGSEVRRKFFDQAISTVLPSYLQDLMMYQRILQQRNSLLHHFGVNRIWDENLLQTYDDQLTACGCRLVMHRKVFIQAFQFAFRHAYASLSGYESAEIRYESEVLGADFGDLLLKSRTRDRDSQRTSCGPHRDDFAFLLNGFDLRKTASQGQQKSFITALKLGLWHHIREHSGLPPILLLDDLFDKLDDERVSRLLQHIATQQSGQIFITDTHTDRTRFMLEQAGLDYELRRTTP